MTRTRTRTHGFTLIEMLVALAVFAMLGAASVGVLAWAADQQEALRTRMERLGEVQRAHALLKNDLGQVALRRTRNADGSAERNAFLATPPDARETALFGFVRRGWENPDAQARASLQYVEYRLVDGKLERRTRDALDGTQADTVQTVLGGVKHARAFFHSYRHWSDGWGGGVDTLPEAVKLELELDDFGAVTQIFLLPDNGT